MSKIVGFMPIVIRSTPPDYIYLRASMYVDLSNFIGVLRNILGIREGELRDKEVANNLASGIHSLFVELSHTMLTNIRSIRFTPFRLYCYGTYKGAEREFFRTFEERLKSLKDVETHLYEIGKGKREKGIDVKLATDMLIHAVWDNYDAAILMSGDADFEPVVRRVRDLGKKVYVYFYSFNTADELKKSSDGLIDIHPGKLAEFLSIKKVVEDLLPNCIDKLIEELKAREFYSKISEHVRFIENNVSKFEAIVEPLKKMVMEIAPASDKKDREIIFKAQLYWMIIEKFYSKS